MNADWDDAPRRARKKPKGMEMIVSIALTLCMFTALAYFVESKGLLGLKPSTTQQDGAFLAEKKALESGKPSSLDSYDEQVSALLRQSAADNKNYIERARQQVTASNELPKQTSFNDSNYTAQKNVNSISMTSQAPSSMSQASEAQRKPYVTVVEETKRSCWMLGEGSVACRRFKRNMQQADQRACNLNNNKAACNRANAYGLR